LASIVFHHQPHAAAHADHLSPADQSVSNTPLSGAIRRAPAVTPPAVRNEQRAAETIVEDYAYKRRLNLPSSLVVYHDRAGAIAEQYRKMRDALMADNARREPQMLVVTSSSAGEGKTITAFNLALSLAEIRANRVLLIDGCLHASRRSLSSLLRQQHEPGLAEILGATAGDAVDGLLKATPWHNLFLLPAGAQTTPTAAASLLQSQNLRAALRRLRANFQWILVDAPPASLPDAGLLGAASDGMLLAVAMHRTSRDRAESTIRRLRSMNLPLKSCILTRA
jgi:Mrp family chromosome partitioning ATPase